MISYSFDQAHGSVYDSWVKSGAPETPAAEELRILKGKSELGAQISHVDASETISVKIKPHGVTLLEFTPVE